MPRRDHVKHPYPTWALPHPRRSQPERTPEREAFFTRRGKLGGAGRARACSKERLREIALLGVAARLARSTPESRRAQASRAAIAANKKRWGPRRVDVAIPAA